MFFLSKTSETVSRDDILQCSGAYAAVVRPDSEESRQMLYSQDDIVLFATYVEDEESPEIKSYKETIESLERKLEESERNVCVLRELNKRLMFEITELRKK